MAKPSLVTRANLATVIQKTVDSASIVDIHTHLYDPAFGSLLLWGIDELLTYHYLVAEAFRHHSLPADRFWRMSKTAQADLIWTLLFLDQSPVSEARRGVLTALQLLGIDARKRDLGKIRTWFRGRTVEDHADRVLELGHVRTVVMTNNPFDDRERPLWLRGWKRDERFKAALRIDEMLMHWEKTIPVMQSWGYSVGPAINAKTASEGRRFLADWHRRMRPLYVAASLPPTFAYPDASIRTAIIDRIIVPHCREHGIPLALMIGVDKLVNPQLGLAGDSLGRAEVGAVSALCAQYPQNKFLCTMLSRENQHELCVAARKFHNLMIFGCWWFLSNPSIIEEITRERLELLGLSFIPQHSDARVLDQVIYKWDHSRRIIAGVLADKYGDLLHTGWQLTKAEIERDVQKLFAGNFEQFLSA